MSETDQIFVAFARLTERMRFGRHHIVRDETYGHHPQRILHGTTLLQTAGYFYKMLAWCGYAQTSSMSQTFLVDEKGYASLAGYICQECEAARTPH